ncbi:nitroreductase [Clostridium oceanicum]|uniref:Nitroreductase n=2 Tax=Clostridium oceanicum TaxID=1543 RepID=A0ABP3UJ54_9CLOT
MIMNDTLKAIMERRTTRKFKEDQIKEEEINTILKAGMYAPSAHNDQPWNFTVIQNKDLLNELNKESKEIAKTFPNETIKKMGHNEKLNIFYGAPTIIVISGRENAMMPQIDCAAATENMLIAAESLDIGGCWNGIVGFLFDSNKVEIYKEKLGIPEGYRPYYAIALGYKKVKITKALPRKENSIQYIK